MNDNLHGITASEIIGEYQSVVRSIRKEEVVLARLRLGHTRVTHSYLLLGEKGSHNVLVAMYYSLYVTSFLNAAQVRNNNFRVDNMKQLFQD